MATRAEPFAPILAGVAGLAWFWLELAPQRTGFEDTDNPATGLRFVAAHPESWQQAGLALAFLGIALIATVLWTRDRLLAAAPEAQEAGTSQVSVGTVSVIGLIAAAMLLAMGAVRLSGGPLLYVDSLDQRWGEAAYLVTQFVGVQLFAVGGVALLAAWIVGAAWMGVRRGAIPRSVALLAILPAIRLVTIPGIALLPDEAWILAVAAIPGTFVWLILLGLSQARLPVFSPLAARQAAR